MSPSIRTNRHGQMAMTDAILFMTLMIIACAVVLGPALESNFSATKRDGLQQYTEDFTNTLLTLELDGLCYTNQSGGEVNFSGAPKAIQNYLVEEVLLVYQGVPRSNFAEGYESAILSAGMVLQRPGTDFAIFSEMKSQGVSIFLSGSLANQSELPGDRCASQRASFLSNGEYEVNITVFVWVV